MTDPSARIWAELTRDGGTLSVQDFISQKLTTLSVLLHRRVTRRYLEAHGISLSEWRMLALLQAAGTPIAAVEATQRSRMDKGQISRSLMLLRRKKLVVRAPDPADGRRQILKLTAKAHATFDAIMKDARHEQARVLLELSVAERKQLLRLMDRVTEVVERLPADDE